MAKAPDTAVAMGAVRDLSLTGSLHSVAVAFLAAVYDGLALSKNSLSRKGGRAGSGVWTH